MTYRKWAAICALVLMATAVSPAQQKFPLRSGEWAATTPGAAPNDPPIVLLYCLNDEMWQKALTQDPNCTVQNLSITPIGASYYMNCDMKVFQMKGKVTMAFDGMQHMTAKGSIDLIMSGKTTNSATRTDYRWKGPTCSPNDMNMRASHAH